MQPWSVQRSFWPLTLQGASLYDGLFGSGSMRFSFSLRYR